MSSVTQRVVQPVAQPAGQRPEDQRLPLPATLGYGVQHILAMFGGVIAVPIIVGGAAGLKGADLALLISSCLFLSGLATVLQTIGLPCLGAQLPLVQGVSFASVSTLLAIIGSSGTEGLRTGYGAIIVAALLGLAITPFFAQIIRFFPPLVTGTIITVIGLSLMPVAGHWVTGQEQLGGAPNPSYGAMSSTVLALLTLGIILALSKVRVLSRLAILLGLVAGTLIALATGHAQLGTNGASWVALPQPFAFGGPIFAIGAIVSMFIVIVVTMVETTADIVAVGEVIDAEVSPRRVADGLRADMAASAIAPVFNVFPLTAFAQNVGLVALTGVASRFAVAAGGVVLAVLGLSPALAAIVGTIPLPVLGGAGIALFGSVAASGIRTLSTVNFHGNQNLLIVAVAVGLGLIPELAPAFWSGFPEGVQVVFGSGISTAAITAVLLNALFNMNASAGAASTSRA